MADTISEDEIIKRSLEAVALMKGYGYENTASGSGGSTLFFLKKVTSELFVHGTIFLKRNQIVLDIIGMLDFGISLESMELPLDTTLFEKVETRLLDYIGILLGEPIKVTTPKKEPLPIEERNKAFWELIRQEGKEKGYEREMCTEFYKYWTECNPGGKKVRWEKEATFQVDRRLETWLRNDKRWNSRYASFQEKKVTQEMKDIEEAGTKVVNIKHLF